MAQTDQHSRSPHEGENPEFTDINGNGDKPEQRKKAGEIIGDIWNRRYEKEGHIWGDTPSPTAKQVVERLEKIDSLGARILEVGFGYGRDIAEYISNTHTVYGIETAIVGMNEAMKTYESEMVGTGGRVHLLCGEFTSASLGEDFDVLASHRMLHLLQRGYHVKGFANKAFRVLKPNGLLVVSARDERDFDPEQMKRNADGSAEYTIEGRKGHLISFWNRARFEKEFGEKFEILETIESSEPESLANSNKTAHFTIMVARKMTPEEIDDKRHQSSMGYHNAREHTTPTVN